MQFSLDHKTASLSVGDFSDFAPGPRESFGGPQGLWRAQLGQHWHNELKTQVERDNTVDGELRPDVSFEVPIEGRLVHRGWTITLTGRIDQIVGATLREIKTVTRPLPVEESELRADYPEYFLQLATYIVLRRLLGTKDTRGELVFVEAGSGLAQSIALTPFDEALVHHQLDALVEFLNQQLRAKERRRTLRFRPPFTALRPGQETIQADLATAFAQSSTVLFEAPTGYGKTGCVLEFALGQLQSGRFSRLIWLTGKSTGQIQVVHTLQQMTAGTSLPVWQVRNKAEHCVNHTYHCVRDGCDYLKGGAERWPGSGLSRFYLNENEPHDLETLRAAGRAAKICPYEITRTALAFNDVWIGDYNYVFAPDNRGLFFDQPGFDPRTTLLAIDEAHNLPTRVADAYSHRANDNDARLLLTELDHLRAPGPLLLAVEAWTMLLAALQPTDAIDAALESELHDCIERIVRLTNSLPLDYAALGPQHSETLWQFVALDDFLADPNLRRLLWCPRVGELNFTCTDASAAIGETLGRFGGAILMSATLQPYVTMAAACGLNSEGKNLLAGNDQTIAGQQAPTNYATLHAPAPWRENAYDVAVDMRVETTFKQRASYYGTTAAAVEAMHAASNKAAVAVFFPSYAYAESVQRALENSGSVLRVALQPKLPDLAAQNAWVEESLALTDALFLVLGSSFAEGIDLLGGRVTHAMVVGPALPEVNAVQKARLDTFSGLGREAAFRRVYQIPGLQKVNQALGRLVRAPGQKAKVLLHCRRFADTSYSSLLAMEYQFYREIATEAELHEWLKVN